MSYDPETKSSAQLEREVEEQRNRVEARLGEIKDRLSPGQLLDEALAYTKDGGSHFASNLGHTVAANPLPATLLGVSLAWLMSGQGAAKPAHEQSYARTSGFMREPEYPYARIKSSGLRRVGHMADEHGQWWSEFETGDGGRYRAKSNEKGHRLGHFMDETGKFFGGFIDEAGNRIQQFQDESGNVMDDATGWASHTWSDMQHGIAQQAQNLKHMGEQVGQSMQKQTDQLTRQLGTLFEQQPLVAGALAFAAGAALAAALPHTREEDKLVGEVADNVRREAGKTAAELYEEGKEKVGEVYEEAADTAGRLYGDAKDRLNALGSQTGNGQSGYSNEPSPSSYSRH